MPYLHEKHGRVHIHANKYLSGILPSVNILVKINLGMTISYFVKFYLMIVLYIKHMISIITILPDQNN